ncbi:pentatricopeptide repeat-containing protein At4g02750 [Selaginella moellendorffii]|uniref:pentatricopeptide repeat-containing protein At4g02750 n=1 Tax=Selaginella moellendorffii TaxID=88036 RepID=UPI000D1CA4FA|nr:pentatricopeptide repeat-containing protein At4g02750 [Selaginella moellendorffii]|eukprot:XP_024523870.1 pentatricopeptide repeat-containing protein At4g02750 [Selaginella moellendorffii]
MRSLRFRVWKDRSFSSLACSTTHSVDSAEGQREVENRYAALIRKCRHLHEVRRVHGQLAEAGFDGHRYLTNVLIQMYGNLGGIQEAKLAFERMPERNPYTWNFLIVASSRNGHLEEARMVFDKLPEKSAVTWNTMISCYAQKQCVSEAKCLFDSLPVKDVFSRNILLTAYAQSGNLAEAKEMFDSIPSEELTSICWNNILTAYSQNRQLPEAKSVFDRMTERTVESWNAMITAYVGNGEFAAALHLFRLLKLDGTRPNKITFTCVAEACSSIGDPAEGRALFQCVTQSDETLDVLVGNGFVNMFTKCGSLDDAKLVYDMITEKNSIAGTSMVNAYAQEGRTRQAKLVFDEMVDHDVVSWTTMLAAYLNNGHITSAENLFALMPARDYLAWSTMVLAYAIKGNIELATKLHEEMPVKDATSWTALISGHARAGHSKQALAYFKLMDLEGIEPDRITLMSALEACASSTALAEGKTIFEGAAARGLDRDTFVGTALVSMFGKCGRLDQARALFNNLPLPNVVSWTNIIVAYAQSGERSLAAEMFNRMDLQGEQPNWLTFSTVLAACSHGGLLEDARCYFLRMIGDNSIDPVVEHYRCLVDLLGRSGQLDRMEDLANEMPFEGDEVSWTAVLGACSLHGDTERGGRIAKQLLEMDLDRGSALYLLLANLYTSLSNGNAGQESRDLEVIRA